MRLTVRFPLGVYHAQSQHSHEEPEWPPHPIRLIGALLAAAHSPGRAQQKDRSLERDLALLEKLCAAPAPLIGAPQAASIVAPRDEHMAVHINGATRWAPRNYFSKKGREQAGVQKIGVALGDRSIHFDWPQLELELESDEHRRLSSLARDVSFLGTTRSPVVVDVESEEAQDHGAAWIPEERWDRPGAPTVAVRVPDATTLAAFERRDQARRSSKATVESATAAVPGIRIGREVGYAHSRELEAIVKSIDPHWWGEMIVLAVDRVRSEVIPRSGASYLFARAVRTALLGAFEEPGAAGEAPAILRGRDGEAHCAIVPLADVWHERSRGGGEIKGVAIVLPSAERVNDLPRQRAALDSGLAGLVRETNGEPRRYVQIPKSGRIWLRQPGPKEAAGKTLLKQSYRRTAREWVTVTPVVHARWRKGVNDTLLEQVARDCSHVGLPAPVDVAPVRGGTFPGAASRPVATGRVPAEWRKSLGGPVGHLRMTFQSPVVGPVLLGRARHFGLGLFVPAPSAERARAESLPSDTA